MDCYAKIRKLLLRSEFLESIVIKEYQDAVNLSGLGRQREGEEIQLGIVSINGLFVHAAFPGEQPFQIQARVVEQETLQKIVAGFVAAGENMRDTSARDGERVGKLCLREIFGLQKL